MLFCLYLILRYIESRWNFEVRKMVVSEDVNMSTCSDNESEMETGSEVDDNAGEASENEGEQTLSNHKKSLKKLEQTDPEFYKFLEEHDKNLLVFSDEDEKDDDEEDVDDEDADAKNDKTQDVDSEESDFEDDAPKKKIKDGKGRTIVTQSLIEHWQQKLRSNDKCYRTLVRVMNAFQAALQRVKPEDSRSNMRYRVDGGAVFNGVIQLCVVDLQPALVRFMGIKGRLTQNMLEHNKKFLKIRNPIKKYALGLIELIGAVSSENIVCVLLKHLHQLLVFVVSVHLKTMIFKKLLRRLVSLWSTSSETIRVIAFVCLLRLAQLMHPLLEGMLKRMYISYVANCKFMSPTTMGSIQFMRKSLAELFGLDETIAYHHGFLYIRQLAIHLRNAVTVNSKESIQAVYNWQYVSSLNLWVDLLVSAQDKEKLHSLQYPLIQIIIGCIKLVPAAKYYPLRFKLIRMLTKLSTETGVFIPVLPLILEVLNNYDFNKRNKVVSMKPMTLTCVLTVSKQQLAENAFKDAIMDLIYSCTLEYLSGESYRQSFPDLVVFANLQIKKFTKSCTNSHYVRKLKQLLEKINENSKFIDTERRKAAIPLNEEKKIRAWELNMRQRGTPLGKFFASYSAKSRRDALIKDGQKPMTIKV
ncbi:nucleolar complex protein 2 [Bemisia tabaci]